MDRLRVWWWTAFPENLARDVDLIILRKRIAAVADEHDEAKREHATVVAALERFAAEGPQDTASQAEVARRREKLSFLQTRLESCGLEAASLKVALDQRQKHHERMRRMLMLIVMLQFVMPLLIWNGMAGFKHLAALTDLALPIATLTLLVYSFLLFQLRRDFRRIYGAAELIVAVVVAHASAGALLADSGERALVQGAAAIYLGVRALDNLSAGHAAATRTRDEALAAAKEAGIRL